MSSEFSVWSLIWEASFVVKTVMIILLGLSIMSWTMIFKRGRDLSQTEKRLNLFEDRFWSGIDLSKLYVDLNSQPSASVGEESLFRAGFKEFTRLRQLESMDRQSSVEGIERAMRVAYMRERDRLEHHLPFLATVGSTSPYLGLFGTVWGIMNSFLALAQAKQATLTVVAPAIAEALIATAMGLAAAIPAVIAYNKFSAQVDRLLSKNEAFADEFSSILQRQLPPRD